MFSTVYATSIRIPAMGGNLRGYVHFRFWNPGFVNNPLYVGRSYSVVQSLGFA